LNVGSERNRYQKSLLSLQASMHIRMTKKEKDIYIYNTTTNRETVAVAHQSCSAKNRNKIQLAASKASRA